VWAPDETTIAFLRATASGRILRIDVVGSTGGAVRELRGVTVDGYGLSWSPHGKRILFAGKGARTLVTLHPGGADSASPTWSPDGRGRLRRAELGTDVACPATSRSTTSHL
jgi:Tol biopolymer transport system component